LRLQQSSAASSDTRIRPRALFRRCQAQSTSGGGFGGFEPPGQGRLDQLEALARVARLRQPLLEERRLPAEGVFERDDASRQLVHRDAEDPACRERGEVDLQAAHLAVVLDHRARVVEPGDERAEVSPRPVRLDQPELGPEPEDEDDTGGNRLSLPPRASPRHGIAVVPICLSPQSRAGRADLELVCHDRTLDRPATLSGPWLPETRPASTTS
jgi:hypothetical protein